MDKLKPLILHKFWILFLIALILPPIAWMQTTGALSKETGDRITALDGVLKGIPTGVDAPNDDWTRQAQSLAEIRDRKNQLALKQLWNEQVKTRVWSLNVTRFMRQDREKTKVCPYRGELPDQNEREQVPDIYKDEYSNEVSRVWRIVFPREDRSDPKRAKIVDFPLLAMPRVRAQTWQSLPPTWPEIWESMEDLWLLEQLFSSVQRTNSFATNHLDANVKRIESVELFAGKRVGPTELGGAGGGMGGGGDSSMGMTMSGLGGGTTGGAVGFKPITADFPLSEEYTVATSIGLGGGGLGMGMQSSMGGGSVGADASGGAKPASVRYIQDTPAFRTRGFKIRVIVRQQNAPEFMREILNSKYPIEISRMQMVSVNAPFGAGSAIGAGMSGGMMSSGGFGESTPSGFGQPSSPDLASGAAVAYDPTNLSSSSAGDAGLSSGTSGGILGGAAGDAAVYSDSNLVILVIVGEMFLYNEPKLPETPAADPATATPAVPADGTPATPTGDVPVAVGVPAVKAPTAVAVPAAEVPAVVDPDADPSPATVLDSAAVKPMTPAKPVTPPATPAGDSN